MKKSYKLLMFFAAFALLASASFACGRASAEAKVKKSKPLQIKYDGRTVYYKGKQIVSYIDGKKVKADGTKGIKLKKQLMVSYKDVFKKGCKIKADYKESSGKLTLKANGMSASFKLGSKKATINGKKKTLKQAPVKVRYVKKKKSKILVPAKVVANAFGYDYEYSPEKRTFSLTTPFLLYYNKEWHVYKKYFGGLVFDNVTADMNYMPAMSIGGSVMIPAEQVLKNVMGLDYSYNPQQGAISVKSLEHTLTMTAGSTSAALDGAPITVSAPPTLVKRKDTGAESMMVPAYDVINMLGYYYDWNKTLSIITIHTKTYFSWKADVSEYDRAVYSNAVTGANATYDIGNKNIIIKAVFEKPLNKDDVKVTDEISSSRSLLLEINGVKNLISNPSHAINGKTINTVSLSQSEPPQAALKLVITFNSANIDYKYEINGNELSVVVSEEVSADYAIRFGRPDTVQFADITTRDDYMNNRFYIYLPGKHEDFYEKNKISVNSPAVLNTGISYNADRDVTEIVVNTASIQGFKLVSLGAVIGVIVDDPNNVYEHIVVLDPGHGGKDPGAKKGGVNECDLNFTILYEYAKEYFDSPDSNVKAYWTRTTDTFITLADRAAFAKKVGADIFISLHMNSAASSSASGTEVYFSNYNNSPSPDGITSYNLAAACISRLVENLKTARRGIKEKGYYVIKNNSVPAVLIELGFLTNKSDLSMLTSPESQKIAAKSIFDAAVAILKG